MAKQELELKLRLPGSRTPVNVALKKPLPQLTARETLIRIASQLKLKNATNYHLVVSPTASNPLGSLIQNDVPITSLLSNLAADSVLELWLAPETIMVGLFDGSSTVREPREMTMDLKSPLRHMIPAVQNVYAPYVSTNEISFVYAFVDIIDRRIQKARPLVTFESLRNQDCTQNGSFLLISPLSIYERLPVSSIVSPVMSGYLMKQSKTNSRQSAQQKRFFILKEGHLYYFGSPSDSAPKGVLALEYWSVTKPLMNAKKSIASIVLSRTYEGFVSKHGQEYTLSGAPEEIRSWHEAVFPRCSNGGGQKKIFAVELKELYARKDEETLKEGIPAVVFTTISFLDHCAADQEGLYRVSGSSAHLEYLREQFDQALDADLAEQDPHTVAQLLKLFFRDLPSPLFTFENFDSFMQCTEERGGAQVVDRRRLLDALAQLPIENLRVLEALCLHLARVASHSSRNRMTCNNLAVCLAPSLLRSGRDEDMSSAVRATTQGVAMLEFLISNAADLFRDLHTVVPGLPPPPPSLGPAAPPASAAPLARTLSPNRVHAEPNVPELLGMSAAAGSPGSNIRPLSPRQPGPAAAGWVQAKKAPLPVPVIAAEPSSSPLRDAPNSALVERHAPAVAATAASSQSAPASPMPAHDPESPRPMSPAARIASPPVSQQMPQTSTASPATATTSPPHPPPPHPAPPAAPSGAETSAVGKHSNRDEKRELEQVKNALLTEIRARKALEDRVVTLEKQLADLIRLLRLNPAAVVAAGSPSSRAAAGTQSEPSMPNTNT